MVEGVAWLVVVTIPLIVIFSVALFHVVARRPELKVVGKAGWIAVIVLLPYIGALLYALFRPPAVAAGKEKGDGAEAGTTMSRAQGLIDGHASGAIADNEFAAAKATLFGLE